MININIDIVLIRHIFKIIMIPWLILISSCGGGNGSASTGLEIKDTSTIITSSTNKNNLTDICITYGGYLSCSLMHDGLQRDFILYVPQTYNAEVSSPLLFNFHGFGGNAEGQLQNSDFRALAEQNNFILIVPNGSYLAGNRYWNSASSGKGVTDDVGFVSVMLETVSQAYTIDLKRVYAAGMSNGGMMSYYLACALSSKVAAIASVTGDMSLALMTECKPSHATAVMHVHGTEDNIVPWERSESESIKGVVDFWSNYNNCSSKNTAKTSDNADGYGEYLGNLHQYSSCDNQVKVYLNEIIGMGHIWPTRLGGKDSEEVIWDFLSQFSIDGQL